MDNKLRSDALAYHRFPSPGKMETIPTKAFDSPADLSLAYSPGVAYPCLEIEKNPDAAFSYTNRSNLVAVISNGTAVLGLGNIGAEASKPVMEGKAMLFKIFAGIDAYDIEIDQKDTDRFIDTVRSIACTFGGINLEDIKAPECFEIEQRLVEECNIPIMHDDQHGTAIISAAGLLNALELQGKDIASARMVINGAGAAANACARLYCALGLRRENIVMCDSKGPITVSRTDINSHKREFATTRTNIHSLADAVRGADVFVGLSVANVLTPDMVRSMAPKPIVFALANPDPEIAYEEAMASRSDIIMATGRSDYPNQINNVLGFPYIFRAALDCRATRINEEMKKAAAIAIAAVAHRPVPGKVKEAYGLPSLAFGPEYILPKPFDRRLLTEVTPEIVKAAQASGVAREPVTDFATYARKLDDIICANDTLIDYMMERHVACFDHATRTPSSH